MRTNPYYLYDAPTHGVVADDSPASHFFVPLAAYAFCLLTAYFIGVMLSVVIFPG